MNSVSRRVVLRGSLALGAIATVGVAAPAAQAQPPLTETPDQQLDRILQALESMPQHLKEADPKTYPNYEKAINRTSRGSQPSPCALTELAPGRTSISCNAWRPWPDSSLLAASRR